MTMIDREQLVLRPYQQRMEDHVIDHYHCALWADMGAGKTATLLSAMICSRRRWLTCRWCRL